MSQPIASFSGIASGIQWRDMVDQIIAAERRPVVRLESQLQLIQRRTAAWRSVQTGVTALRDALKPLSDSSAFGRFSSTLSGMAANEPSPVLVSAGSGAAPGSFRLQVEGVAQRAKVGSSAFSSRTDGLGVEGSLVLNGRAIELAAGDSLNAVAAKLNAANQGSSATGVSASIVRTPSGSHRLVLTADRTGASGLTLAGDADVLASLGLSTSPGATSRHAVLGPRLTDGEGVAASAASQLTDLGFEPGDSIDFAVTAHDGTALDFSWIVEDTEPPQTLGDLVAALQADLGAATGATFRVQDGRIVAEADVAGPSSLGMAITTSREDHPIAGPALVRSAETSLIAQGRDAALRIDGALYHSATNSFEGIVDGVTFTVVRESASVIDAGIVRDAGASRSAVKAVVDAYNSLADIIRQQSNSATKAALAGNSVLRGMQSSLRTELDRQLEAAAGQLSRLGDMGIQIDRNGRYTFDTKVFDERLAADPAGVAELAKTIATATQKVADDLLGGRSGSIPDIINELDAGTPRLNARIEHLEDRLDKRREDLYRRFTKMEQALSRAQTQSQWLASQLAQFEPARR